MLAALIAMGLLIAACAGGPADGAVGEPPPDTAQPVSTTDDTDDTDGGVTSRSADEDAAASKAEHDDDGSSVTGSASQDHSAVGRSADDEAVQTGAPTPATAVEATALRSFGECGALLDYVYTYAAEAAGPWGFDGGGFVDGPVAIGMAEDMESAADVAGAGSFGDAPLSAGEDYSTSNIQEAGVDEPDVAKTDGRRLVVAVHDTVHVVDVTGPTPRQIGSVSLGGDWVSRLLLVGDRVVAFVSRWGFPVEFEGLPSVSSDDADTDEPEPEADDEPARPGEGWGEGWGPATDIVEIDISGAQPRLVRRLTLDGDYVGARMIDGVMRLVTSSQPRFIPWVFPVGDSAAELSRAAAANAAAVASTDVEHWLPRYLLTEADGTLIANGSLGSCERTFAPADFGGPGTLSVTTIDLSTGGDGLAEPLETTSILAGGRSIYASAEHLYVTTTRWEDARRWQELAGRSGSAVEVPDTVTEVHQFDISDPAGTAYVTTTSVPGVLLNQYSMSEHDGYLRVATTVSPPWFFTDDMSSESLVTVLDAGDGSLSQIGQVDGLGLGERIFAVRYMGEVAAVVTFRQVDPLYLIDLSDPAAPQVRGELKITGYSAYLHPLGDDLLLGVGQEADFEGVTQGSQVSLFDIADLDRPQRIAQWTMAGARSSAEFDALRFLYWPPAEMMVMPVTQYIDGDDTDGPSALPLLGAVALSTADRQLAELARLSHADEPTRRCTEQREIVIRPDGTEERGPLQRYCWYEQDWEAQIAATVVAGERLHLASAKGLQTVDLATLEPVGLLRWAS